MNRFTSPASPRWAIILLGVTVLALGGCGRKAGLDLPPNAAAQAEVEAERSAPSGAFNPSSGVDAGGPAAPKGRKKPFVLDPLLD